MPISPKNRNSKSAPGASRIMIFKKRNPADGEILTGYKLRKVTKLESELKPFEEQFKQKEV